jgi:hypothetical protein
MTPAQLAAIGELLYGMYWYSPMGEDLDVSERTIRRWANEGYDIPPGVVDDLKRIADSRANVVKADMEERVKKALAILERAR